MRGWVSADGWPSDWSLLETWWCSSLPCLLLFPRTPWTAAWSACLSPTLSMWGTLGGRTMTLTDPAVTLRNPFIFAGHPDAQLAGEDELRAGDQYRSCGESEWVLRDWEWGEFNEDLFIKDFSTALEYYLNSNLLSTGSVDYWRPTRWWLAQRRKARLPKLQGPLQTWIGPRAARNHL